LLKFSPLPKGLELWIEGKDIRQVGTYSLSVRIKYGPYPVLFLNSFVLKEFEMLEIKVKADAEAEAAYIEVEEEILEEELEKVWEEEEEVLDHDIVKKLTGKLPEEDVITA
jgi:hypothetical protein